MDEIILVFPTKELENNAKEYVLEHFENKEKVIHGDGGLDSATSYYDWLENINNNLCESTVEKGKVPSTTYFAIRKSDNRILGTIDIRHRLNEYLKQRGGHIGYGIRPTERRKGYATKMLSLAIDECKKLGINKILLTCDKENVASRSTILKNAGILENEVTESNGNVFQRFWISI